MSVRASRCMTFYSRVGVAIQVQEGVGDSRFRIRDSHRSRHTSRITRG